MISALLLGLAKVPDDTIAEDYALHIGVSPAEIATLRHALVELN